MTESERIILDAEEMAQRYGASYPADRLAYHVGVLQANIRRLCAEAENTQDELKRVQQELLWERKAKDLPYPPKQNPEPEGQSK